MPKPQGFYVQSVEEAVQEIIPYLEDTRSGAYSTIYFDGWSGLAASPVLREIAENPGESLKKKFDKIIHVDCSRWKSRRALQRAIANKVKLPHHVMALFDRQDEDDDFSGVEESSRDEITDIGKEILRAIKNLSCLLIFHNGSDEIVDISEFGFPLYTLGDNRILWTFGGRLRINPKIREKVPSSHLYLYTNYYEIDKPYALLAREATEITRYSHEGRLDGTIAAECCLYLLSLNHQSGTIIDYKWATHACNYWVCDGIIFAQEEEDGHLQEDQAWEVAAALHQEMRLEDFKYSDYGFPVYRDLLDIHPKRWIFTNYGMRKKPTLDTTSLFVRYEGVALLPNDMFHQANNLHVLRLWNCAFSFSSPPFHCCRSLRFLGLDKCMDLPQQDREDKNNSSPALEIFHRLWVLDLCHTDWQLDFPTKNTTEQQMAMDIREVHINKGRIWRNNFAWKRLKNLRKLRVIEPTHPWGKTGEMDEFAGMLKLEFLDLSKNSMIQVLPCLSGAYNLKTLILDGCVGLERVGPQGLPPSLESFSLDMRFEEAKISSISLAGCSRLRSFTLFGRFLLKEIDLSNTIIKSLDLRGWVVQVPHKITLRRVILLGCKQLRAILWPHGEMGRLIVLNIDTLGVQVVRKTSHNPSVPEEQEGYCHSRVAIADIRFLQSLVLRNEEVFWVYWRNTLLSKLNLRLSSAIKDNGKNYHMKKMGYCGTGKLTGSPLHSSLIPMTQRCYKDVNLDMIYAIDPDASSALQLEPQDTHVEIGEGISYANVVSKQVLSAVTYVMNRAESLHVHDNFSITSVKPKHVTLTGDTEIKWPSLKWCCIERCHKLDTVFATDYTDYCFTALESFSAAELMMANSIWSRGRTAIADDNPSFTALRTIYLHSCLRLTFVLPLSWTAAHSHLPSLETIHIVCCAELRQIFPVEPDALSETFTAHPRCVLEFPKLKHIHLHDVPNLQQICEIRRMFAPELKTIRVRGCWSLKRIPATVDGRLQDSCPIVDCEKDWWEKLEWDGLEVGHHPSLFKTRHSRYYMKAMPRGSLLR